MKSLIVLAVLFVLSYFDVIAQQKAITLGRHFIVAFPDTVVGNRSQPADENPRRSEALIVLYSEDTSRVTITSPGYRQQVTVLPDRSTVVSLYNIRNPAPEVFVTSVELTSTPTFDIVSDQNIGVYCMYFTIDGAEAFTPIPVESWGTTYYGMHNRVPVLRMMYYGRDGIPDEEILDSLGYPPVEILVIASTDGTQVTITGTTSNGPFRRNVTLNTGEVYLEERAFVTTKIEASKPVGVLSGNTRNDGKSTLPYSVQLPTGGSMANSGIEWLWPENLLGRTFIYRRLTPFNATISTERGSFFPYANGVLGPRGESVMPIPSQFWVTTGGWVDESQPVTQGRRTWSQAMATLTPYERWFTHARFYSPDISSSANHWVKIVADTGTQVRLDGVNVALSKVLPGFVEALVSVWPGDHTITARGGRFSAIAYGHDFGFERYAPLGINSDDPPGDGKGGATSLHASTYSERLAYTYAYPLSGSNEAWMDYQEHCDSTNAFIDMLDSLSEGPFRVEVDSGVNSVVVVKRDSSRVGVIGYQIRFAPIDRSRDAAATVTIVGRNKRWRIPYTRLSSTVQAMPEVLRIYGASVGADTVVTVSLHSRRAFNVAVKSIHLLRGNTGKGGFLLVKYTAPSALRPDSIYTVPLTYRAMPGNEEHHDSLLIITECDTTILPLHAVQSQITYNPACSSIEAVVFGLDIEQDGPFHITVDSVVNADLQVDTVRTGEEGRVEFRFRFTSIDSRGDASAVATVVGRDTSWRLPLELLAGSLEIAPTSVVLANAPVGVTVPTQAVMRSRRGFPLKLHSIALKRGISNGQGFSLGNLAAITHLQPGQNYAFTINFYSISRGAIYADSLIVITECDTTIVPLSAVIADSDQPYPELSDHDWDRQWLSSASACTRNTVDGYEAVVELGNRGRRAYTVTAVELLGDDARYFSLDRSDPSMSVAIGTVVEAGTMVGSGRHRQRVWFRPDAERTYACVLAVVTDGGDTVRGSLRGEGIETHVEIGDRDFGVLGLNGAGGPRPGVVELRSVGSRGLRVTGLRIGGPDGGSYRFAGDFVDTLPSESMPWTLAPGDGILIRVEFVGGRVGRNEARLEVDGDYARCEDSVGMLTGGVVGLQGGGYDFGRVMVCGDTVGVVEVENGSESAVVVTGVRLVEGDEWFELEEAQLPQSVGAGDRFSVVVRSIGGRQGRGSGRVRFDVSGVDGRPLGSYEAVVWVERVSMEGRLGMDMEVRGYPGRTLAVPVRLESGIDAADARELELRVVYDGGVLRARGVQVDGTLLGDWSVAVVKDEPGEYVVRLKATNWGLKGSGELARLEFDVYLGGGSDVEVELEVVGEDCIDLGATTRVRPEICGLSQRLIELLPGSYALEEGRPNPFNPTTEIEFTLGLDGPTRLTIHDATGREVVVVVDEHLAAGRYIVAWDASGYGSGVYYCRLSSGTWTQSRPLMLIK